MHPKRKNYKMNHSEMHKKIFTQMHNATRFGTTRSVYWNAGEVRVRTQATHKKEEEKLYGDFALNIHTFLR